MGKALFKNQTENKWNYEIEDGRVITLLLVTSDDDEDDSGEEDLVTITFLSSDGSKLKGEFEFKKERPYGEAYLLRRMYSPFKDCGLGRAALNIFKCSMKSLVYVRPHDEKVCDDGSHLTEDAPGFVHKMREEGLIMAG